MFLPSRKLAINVLCKCRYAKIKHFQHSTFVSSEMTIYIKGNVILHSSIYVFPRPLKYFSLLFFPLQHQMNSHYFQITFLYLMPLFVKFICKNIPLWYFKITWNCMMHVVKRFSNWIVYSYNSFSVIMWFVFMIMMKQKYLLLSYMCFDVNLCILQSVQFLFILK